MHFVTPTSDHITHLKYLLRQFPVLVERENLKQVRQDRGSQDRLLLADRVHDMSGACTGSLHPVEMYHLTGQRKRHHFIEAQAHHDLTKRRFHA